MATNFRYKHLRGTTEQWSKSTIVPLDGELVIEERADGTVEIKVGNGKDLFVNLPYISKENIIMSDLHADLQSIIEDAHAHSQASHARTDATKVETSDTNGGIKINGVEATVYTHPESHPASMITGLADVATSGSYDDLTNIPTINGVALSGEKTSSDLKLGLVTADGGFQAGTDASATYGGAVGHKANAGYGAAVGNRASATTGGAIGHCASATIGGAVGNQASTTTGGAVGSKATASNGGAVGYYASTTDGGAVGYRASANEGFAGGYRANALYASDGTTKVVDAVAIGRDAKAQANDAIQLGTGTNANANTLQFRSYPLVDANGKIPSERLPEVDFSDYYTKSETYELISNHYTKSETDELIQNITPKYCEEITYAELKSLRDKGELVPGMQYRITDFVTTTSQPDTQSAGHPFNIIVTALSNNTLSENASADYHPREADVHCYYKLSIGTYEGNAAIVEFGTATNNNGEVVPVLYHGNDEGVNYDDKWFYIGTYDLEGEIFDRWQLIEIGTVEDGAHTWDSEYKKFILTNIVVQDNALTITDIGDLEIAYTIYDDDEHVYEGTQEGLMNSDKIVDRGYKENNMGEVVPVLYKTDIDNFADETDYADTMYYVGRYEYKGTTYDRWRKIEDNGVSWEDGTQYYVLTNIIVENNKFIGGTDPYFANAKLPAWEIKYCLDNDKTRFAWAVEGEGQAIINLDSSLSNGRPLTRQPSMDGQSGYDDYPYAWGTQEDVDDGDNTNFWYSQNEVLTNGDTVCREGNFDNATVIKIGEGKGVIYYMKDEWNNECPYDFKNIQFKRYKVTEATNEALQSFVYNESIGQDCYYGTENSIDGVTIDLDDFIWCYTFMGYPVNMATEERGEWQDGSLESPYRHTDMSDELSFTGNIVKEYRTHFIEDDDDGTKSGLIYLNNIVFYGYWYQDIGSVRCCGNNKFGGNCHDITLGPKCSRNTFGDNCHTNTFEASCHDNTFGNFCSRNTFGASCYGNTFGASCSDNTFGEYSRLIIFGNRCKKNTIKRECIYITFGAFCEINIIEQFTRRCVFEPHIQSVTLCGTGGINANNYLQNITVSQGIANKTINATRNADYQQIFRTSGSQEILVD